MNIAHNPVQHDKTKHVTYKKKNDKTKHVEVDHHFIKEKLEVKVIYIPYVPIEEQLIDVLTKGLHIGLFN